MPRDLFSVKDQIVLVSGASRGIGRGIAEGFAEQGATVVATGRVAETIEQTAAEIRQTGGAVVGKVCDVADPPSITRLVAEVMEQFGRIDTLVNCAGVNRRMKAIDYTEADYDFITNVNIKGAFLMAQAVGRHMIAAGRGALVNIDSLNSHTPLSHVAPYAMSKAAMSQMTKCLAMEWGPHGVRVNAIGPGFIRTALTEPHWRHEELARWRDANTPLRRIGQPEDIAAAAIFLASDAASYITGQVLYVDGGTLSGLFWPFPE
jgi:gluconate 5-dehydrogenase